MPYPLRQTIKRFARHSLAPTACLALAAACSGSGGVAGERARRATGTGDIVIAVAWPWQAGRDMRFGDGIDMAVDEINRGGGVLKRRLRTLRVDDHGTVDEGQLVAQRIASNPDIMAVIGHLQSHVSVPAAAIYQEAGLVMFAPATTDPELTEHGYTRVFRGTFTHVTVGRQMADYAASRGYTRLSVYYARDPYGRGLANAFEDAATRLGLTVIDRQSYDAGDSVSKRAFTTALSTSRALGIDAIFLAGEVPAAGEFIAVARESGVDVPIFGGDGLSSSGLLHTAGAAAEGTVVASMFHPDEPRDQVRRFTSAFETRYGAPPDAAAALGYDAVHVLASAMQRAGTPEPSAVAQALRVGGGTDGVTARFAFDSTGNLLQRNIVPLVVRRGQFEYLAPPRVAVKDR